MRQEVTLQVLETVEEFVARGGKIFKAPSANGYFPGIKLPQNALIAKWRKNKKASRTTTYTL